MAEIMHTPLEDGVVCVEINGEFDLADLPRAEDLLPAALNGATSALLLDLSRCEFIDSSGIRTLIGANGRAREAGLRFAIAGAEGHVRRVLELTGLADRLPMFNDRETALRELSTESS